MLGVRVLFKGKTYIIKFKYASGMCELQEIDNPFHYELVHTSEIL